MILPPHHIGPSRIPGAGRGLFLDAAVPAAAVVIAPDRIERTYGRAEMAAFGPGSPEDEAAVRWFESWYTVSLDWPDECNVNHSFEANGLWHLGFVFAARAIAAGEELTVDYRFLVGDGERLPFKDAHTGLPVVGLEWRENLRRSTAALAALLGD